MGCFMYQYPKQILTTAQQVQSYIDAGMAISSRADVEKALKSIGFYRLRGYSFQLSALIFSMISKIEVALRVRLVESLLIHGEPLVLQDSSIFKEKNPPKTQKHLETTVFISNSKGRKHTFYY